MAPPQEKNSPPFVGRTTELLQLEAARDAALAGSTTLVAIVGDAGVGKTRLAQETIERSAAAGFWAYCSADAGDPAYWPVTQLLREIRTHRGEAAFRAAAGSEDEVLLGILEPEKVPWPRTSSTMSDLDRFRLFDRIVTVLDALASVEPLLLVIDDVQFADPSTLRFLRYLAQTLPTAPIALFMTLRTGTPLEAQQQEIVDSLIIDTTSIRVNRFDRRTTGEFLRNVRSGADSVDAAHAATGGNVFLLNEYARLSTAGEPELWERYGPRLESIALGGFHRLDDHMQGVLLWAAVIGTTFDVDLLLAVTDSRAEDVLATLEQAAGLSIIVPLVGNRFRFAHGLTAEAIYARLDEADRTERHRRIATTLESSCRPGDEGSARLANHWLKVPEPDATHRALLYTLGAADRADARYARDDAVSLYRRGLALMDELAAEPELHIDVRLRLGAVLTQLPAIEEAKAVLRRAAELALEHDDVDRYAQVALAFPPGLEGVSIVPTADPEQVALRTDALDRLEDQDSTVRAQLLAGLAVALYWTRHVAGEVERFSESLVEQEHHSAQALAMARRLGDKETLATCLLSRLHAVWGPDHFHERPEITAELLELARELGDLDLVASTLAWLVLEAMDRGELDVAERHIDAYRELAERLGQPLYRRTVQQWTASIQVLRGQIDEGVERTFAALEETAGLIGDLYAFADATLLQSVQLFLRGDLGPIVGPARMVVENDPRVSINWKIGLLFCLSELGEHDEARALFEELTADDLQRIPRDINWLVGMQLLGLTAATLGERRVGEQIYRALLPFADRDTTHGWGYASYGPVGWVLGVLATLAGEPELAIGHYRRVIASRSEGPYRMVVELRLAQLLIEQGGAVSDVVALLGAVVQQARRWSIERFACEAEAALSAIDSPSVDLPVNRVVRTPNGWRVRFDNGGAFDVSANRGVEYLVTLVQNSGAELHALDLVAGVGDRTGRGRPRLSVDDDIRATFQDLGEVIDDAARHAYLRRVQQLRSEMQREEGAGRADRVVAIRDEIAFIEREIRDAVGLRGRTRKIAPEAERARVSVTKAIRRSLKRMDDEAPELATFLRSRVTTGTFCSFDDPDHRWIIELTE